MRRVPPIDKLMYCHKPLRDLELEQMAAALAAKWRGEAELVAANEWLNHFLSASLAVIYSCTQPLILREPSSATISACRSAMSRQTCWTTRGSGSTGSIRRTRHG